MTRGMISLFGYQGGLLYKTPLTASVFKDFSSSYNHLTSSPATQVQHIDPFVYVDALGIKIITNVVQGDASSDGVFALSIAGDGWVEMLAINEAH